eukprot:GHVS01029644.1.p1 GENE.GHVS01029644.1~~GHVS01029644.1.p1  ORF type:complete len:826 (+),score=144.60 GHVS01029644.1:197-2674(+)
MTDSLPPDNSPTVVSDHLPSCLTSPLYKQQQQPSSNTTTTATTLAAHREDSPPPPQLSHQSPTKVAAAADKATTSCITSPTHSPVLPSTSTVSPLHDDITTSPSAAGTTTADQQIHRYCLNTSASEHANECYKSCSVLPPLSSRYAEVEALCPSPVCPHVPRIFPPAPPDTKGGTSEKNSCNNNYTSSSSPELSSCSLSFHFLSDPNIHTPVHCCTDMTAYQLDRNLVLECLYLERISDAFDSLCSLACRYGLLPVIVDAQFVEIVHRHIMLLDAASCMFGTVEKKWVLDKRISGGPKKHSRLFGSHERYHLSSHLSRSSAAAQSSSPSPAKSKATTTSFFACSPGGASRRTSSLLEDAITPVGSVFTPKTDTTASRYYYYYSILDPPTVDLLLRAAVAELHNLPPPSLLLHSTNPPDSPLSPFCVSKVRLFKTLLHELLRHRECYLEYITSQFAQFHEPVITSNDLADVHRASSFRKSPRAISNTRQSIGSSPVIIGRSSSSILRTDSHYMEGTGRLQGLCAPDEDAQWTFIVRDDPSVMIRFKQKAVSAHEAMGGGDGQTLTAAGPKEDLIWLHLEGVVEASALAVVSVLHELDLYRKWIPYFSFPIKLGLRESNRLHQLARIDSIALFKLDFPWPIQNRECLAVIWSADELEERDCISVTISSQSAKDIYNRFGVTVPPQDANVVRIQVEGSMVIRPVTNSSCSIGFLWKINPRMHVPPFLLDFLTKTFTKSAYNAFRSTCESAMASDSPFADRRGKNPFLYDFFSRRFLDVLSSRRQQHLLLPTGCSAQLATTNEMENERQDFKTKKSQKKIGWSSKTSRR